MKGDDVKNGSGNKPKPDRKVHHPMRDAFASAAMQAILTNPMLMDGTAKIAAIGERDIEPCVAMMAYAYADAMVAQRSK